MAKSVQRVIGNGNSLAIPYFSCYTDTINRERKEAIPMSAHSAKFRLVLSMVIYGTIGLFVRSISLPTSLIASFRGAVGAIFLLLVLYLQKEKLDFKAIRANLKILLPVGIVMGFNWMLLFEAYRYTPVAVATVFYYLAPVVVMLVSPFLLKERSSRSFVRPTNIKIPVNSLK